MLSNRNLFKHHELPAETYRWHRHGDYVWCSVNGYGTILVLN